jgi:hypothetical protein
VAALGTGSSRTFHSEIADDVSIDTPDRLAPVSAVPIVAAGTDAIETLISRNCLFFNTYVSNVELLALTMLLKTIREVKRVIQFKALEYV